MKTRKTTLISRPILILALLCSAIATNPAYALTEISSISGEAKVENDTGVYSQVAVQCVSKKEKLYLRKGADSRRWCDAALGQFCDKNKVGAAVKLCGRKYASALKEKNNTPATELATKPATVTKKKPEPVKIVTKSSERSIESLEQEKYEIEQKTLEIEARKLELRRQELALRKQQLALTSN